MKTPPASSACGCSSCGEPSPAVNHPLRAPLAPGRALLRLENAGVRYPGATKARSEWAVHGVTLEIGAGEIIALIGPNGAGKTSLLRAIAGLQPLAEGSLSRLRPEAKAIGYVPQYQAFDRGLPVSVLEFLALKFQKQETGLARFLPFGKGKNEEKALALLDELGVSSLARRPLGSLSGGEMQRVFIAYSLLGDPSLLLLDEPMTGVDIKGGTLFRDLLLDLRQRRNLAIVMVSHDLHMAGGVADVVVCLNRHVCAVGTPAEVLQEHVLAGVYGDQKQKVETPPASAPAR
ncbi:zinc transport system ATP-binding protein [Verrucomicrobium sp. GAS474]|uniref:metal ABC transporter ATP-binding protein n=1 Tax=Verrucomicrobium sp. GAS474 TaxID=1882831 RepID=UPI00087DB191|nr:metal ABC transporter ATP-binding protein [Verrucomicrobium sp. GAS474]SDT87315.1 zinc transport system ATP-binding protein [Verrucomicrobium sp. GAS474]